jgi:ABC-type uncharacterized transport system substrate-binding protein
MGIFLMPRSGTNIRTMSRFAALIAILALSGCSTMSPQVEPVDEPAVVIVPTKVEPPKVELPDDEPPKVVEPPRLPPVAIVLTNSQPAFLDVANALASHLDDFQVYDLSDDSQPPVSILRGINDSDAGTVVALGLRAAKSSVAMADSPVVFGQVFNHQDYELLTANSRGVAPLAPLDAQLAAWTEIDPTLSLVGIILGEGHDDLITEAQLAAQKHNVELRIRISHSDQETLYLFRRMAQDIDGFWLFPDNRILSARSLQQILETSRRGQVAVAVPNESMLEMGATISLATRAEDIAATIAKIIRKIQTDGLQSVPAISPLSAIDVVTRDTVKVANR